ELRPGDGYGVENQGGGKEHAAMGARLLPRGHGDLDAGGRGGELGHADGRARGPRRGQHAAVNCIHAREQAHVGEVDLDGDDVLEVHAGGLEDNLDALEAELHLVLEILGDGVGLEVGADLAGDVKGAVDEDAGAEHRRGGSGSGREFGRVDDLLFG